MKIYVFRRPDDSVWADYSEEHARRFRIIETIKADTRAELEAVIKNAALPRVRALADRALKELLSATKPRAPEPLRETVNPPIHKRSLWQRFKWLLTGL